MNKRINDVMRVFILLALITVNIFAGNNPPVKKSRSGICHPQGGTYYSRTKNYVSYPSMKACLQSGGRASKR